MKREITRYFGLLEKRLDWFHLLAAELKESGSAFTELDLNGMQQHTSHQENLCAEIRFLARELEALQHKIYEGLEYDKTRSDLSELKDGFEPAEAQRLRSLCSEISATQAEVQRLNRVRGALLRRSRRSINVLMNFMANYSATYQPPKPCQEPPFSTLG